MLPAITVLGAGTTTAKTQEHRAVTAKTNQETDEYLQY
jgi:hypothetical protein